MIIDEIIKSEKKRQKLADISDKLSLTYNELINQENEVMKMFNILNENYFSSSRKVILRKDENRTIISNRKGIRIIEKYYTVSRSISNIDTLVSIFNIDFGYKLKSISYDIVEIFKKYLNMLITTCRLINDNNIKGIYTKTVGLNVIKAYRDKNLIPRKIDEFFINLPNKIQIKLDGDPFAYRYDIYDIEDYIVVEQIYYNVMNCMRHILDKLNSTLNKNNHVISSMKGDLSPYIFSYIL